MGEIGRDREVERRARETESEIREWKERGGREGERGRGRDAQRALPREREHMCARE